MSSKYKELIKFVTQLLYPTFLRESVSAWQCAPRTRVSKKTQVIDEDCPPLRYFAFES